MTLSLAGVFALIPAVFAVFFNSCVPARDPGRAQRAPSTISRSADGLWRDLALRLVRTLTEERLALQKKLDHEVKLLPAPVTLPESNEAEARPSGDYGALPDIRVDEGTGAIFPIPILSPERFSWFHVALRARAALKHLRRLESGIRAWHKLGPKEQVRRFDEISFPLMQLQAESAQIGQHARYLESWVPQLLRQYDSSVKEKEDDWPLGYRLARALASRKPEPLMALRGPLKPQRVLKRMYVPDALSDAPGGAIVIPVHTDVSDKKFLAEVEGAIDTHWNQSPWARKNGVSFLLRWVKVPKDAAFAAGKATLAQHLARFPDEEAAMTTGGMTTYMKGHVLVLGPGKINPRTLAHEIGHLIGFGDCYLRTVTGQGVFGLGVLEWDNPFYPDDLMCDNTVGVAISEVW